ncbi:MAG TPA: glycoside hydrolase family 38 C-terminal domain-containing protein [Anaerolineae bacterium]
MEIRPERRAALERLVREGRLFIGPWYVLADEYLVSPEALIRNLLLGMKLAGEMGGVMSEGYVPDSFGHISQLPQILQGFGISSALFWRGMGNEGERLGTEFWWEAPDGSRVLSIHLRDGYHNAANLGYPMRWGDPGAMEFDMNLALQRLREAVDVLKPHTQTGTLLLLNGIDHAEADANVPQVIDYANETLDDVQIEHGTLTDYVARVRAAIDETLPSFQGEFNRGRYTYSLQGVYSSRMYLLQANERAQTLLECYAEPLSAWAWLLGQPYPAGFLQLAWRKLLQNHPHDDICGCSADAVHRENMTRFAEVEQIATTLARDSYRAIMRRIDRTAQPGVPFVLYNPAAWPRAETAELTLTFDEDEATGEDFHLVTADGQEIPSQRLDEVTLLDSEVGKHNSVRQVRVAAATTLPACGYRVYYARPGQSTTPPSVEDPVRILPQGQGMENRHLRVEIQANGTLEVLDKGTGRQFYGLAYFCDDEDAGDEYDYSPCANPERICTLDQPTEIELRYAGPLQVTYEIRHVLELPVSLTKDRQQRSPKRVGCPLVTTATLRYDSQQIDVKTTVDNRARDHRLRVCFPSGIETDVVAADGHFDVLARPIDLPAGAGWEQAPSPTRHQRTFVDLADGEAGLAIFNRGLPEYEIMRDGGNTIAVTLLRCVGALSRNDMLSRPRHAGPGLPTPEAQCLDVHTFEYAIVPHAGDWRHVYRQATHFRAPVLVRRGSEREGHWPPVSERESWGDYTLPPPDLSGDLPSELSFLTLEPDTLILSAVKQSETGDRLIVRFYNPTDETVEAAMRLFHPIQAAQEVNLNETPQSALAVSDERQVNLAISRKEIKTVTLHLDT